MKRDSPQARIAMREERRSLREPKLSSQQMARIRRSFAEGDVTFAELARQFGVDGKLIARVVRDGNTA